MTIRRLNGVLHHLRDDLATTGPSDGQLLERFLARRDEAAFDALVRRHGPMVLGVCRRVLRHTHDAEDAFQATFLVLVRKAASVRPRELVGHWLYGVAYRTALKAKALAAKRSVKERSMPPPETHHDEPPADWLPLLDEELQRLPEKYRLPLVLCDLDGKTRKQAARQLGWPDGTLSTRLTRARLLLAERLTRRSVALAGGAAVVAALGGDVSAQVPATLTTSTVRAAMGFAAGSTATAVSSNVAALTQGVLKTMLLSKLKPVLVIGVLLALVGLGVGAGAFRSVADAQAPPPAVTEPVPPASQPVEPPSAAAKLSLRSLPAPALVSLTRTGTIAVTTRQDVFYYEPVTTTDAKGKQVTSYRLTAVTTTEQYSREDVQVYDSTGKQVSAKEVSRLLKEEVTALVYADGQKPDPLHLKLFKDGMLFVVLPAPKAPPAATAAQPPPAAPANEWFDGPVLLPQKLTPPPTQPAPLPLPIPPADPEKTGNGLSKDQLKLYKELQGEWRLVTHVHNGEKSDPKAFQDFRLEISHGNELRIGFGPSFERANPSRFMLRVSDEWTPRSFDLRAADGEHRLLVLGIYKLEGDELTVVSKGVEGDRLERPSKFEAPEGSKQTLTVYRRVPAIVPH
jgi:RNA polymerase sigma factor (sigma-70 family)